MMSIRSVQLALCVVVTAGAATASYAACFTIYDARDKMVYQSPEVPVDMRYQLHKTVPDRFGSGASMVFTLSEDFCQVVGLDKPAATGPSSAYSGYFGPADAPNASGLQSGARDSTGARGRAQPSVVVAPARASM